MSDISVITICFNNLEDLIKTCASVDMQVVKPKEHWIIDGSTQKEINNWLNSILQPGYRKWVSESDNGISDAMNKGIRKASGEIIHILHSGDKYAGPDIIHDVINAFEKEPDSQWLSGNIQVIRGGHAVTVGKPFEKNKLYKGMRSVSHPTWFVKKEVYDRVGVFNEKYKIAMDYDLLCRIRNEPYLYLNKRLVIFDDTGISSANYLRSLAETREVYQSYFGYSLSFELWQLRLKTLHYLMQTAFGKWLFGLKKKMGLENY